ncbi:MAG: serine/threonine protein kinase, partial [Pseudomonadota bacterium]
MILEHLPLRAALAVVLIATAATLGSPAEAQVTRPLVQEGKTALYQRVITVPGAVLVPDLAEPAETLGVAPFSTYYVYARRDSDGRAWLQIGTDSNGDIDGWID